MEPIRPDDDELRAEAPFGNKERKAPPGARPKSASGGGREKPPEPAKSSKGGGNGNGRGSLTLLWLLLIGLSGAAGAGWYSQNQRIQSLEGQLEEADYWARQSKLALARFEGDLSETGESLQERGASLSDQIANNKKQLETANSEIGKLWVVSNERNKARLNDHQERLAALEKGLAEDGKALSTVKASMEKMRSSFAGDLSALEDQTQTSIVALQEANRQATDQLTTLSKQIAGVDQIVENRIRRFEQEQKLGISGLEGRLSALEKETDALAGDSRVRALQNELASVKKTVQAIDSSRAQLTSRLVRLSEEVNTLRAQLSAK